MATALMPIARKIIILDFVKIGFDYIWAMAGMIFALSIGYFLVQPSTAGSKSTLDKLLPRNSKKTAADLSPKK